MNFKILTLCILFIASCATPKNEINGNPATQPFPQIWVGKWKGDLKIYAPTLVQTVPMELHILPIDSTNRFTKALIYGTPERQDVRPYEFYVVDEKRGHYQTDEKNSIILDDFYFDGILYTRFEVMGNLLLTRIEKRGENLLFEVISGKTEPIATTGNDEKNDIPQVNSFGIGVSQRAILSKFE